MSRESLRSRRWKKKYRNFHSSYDSLRKYGSDILFSQNFNSSRQNIQHGSVTVHQHSLNVAIVSVWLARKLHIKLMERDLVRGALLHDYFLYDWHIPDPVNPHKWHGFHHPGKALKNASAEYELTPRQRDIIEKHMWPLTVKPPLCREAWIVTIADKYVSTLETVHVLKGHGKSIYSRMDEAYGEEEEAKMAAGDEL